MLPIPRPARLPKEARALIDSASPSPNPTPLPPPLERAIPAHPGCVGRYEQVRRVGAEERTEVFVAREALATGKTRAVALKMLRRPISTFPNRLQLERTWLREARAGALLAHPDVCSVYDAGVLDGRLCVAMEWVDGWSLREVLDRLSQLGEPLPPALAAEIAARVAGALDYVHHLRDGDGRPLDLLHADLRPENILLTAGGGVKVSGFGWAALHTGDPALISGRAGMEAGYMAPEQWLRGHVDCRTDVFALGACLHEMLAGTRGSAPAAADSAAPPPAGAGAPPGLADLLDDVVLRALEQRPEHRFQSAGELRFAIEEVLHDSEAQQEDLGRWIRQRMTPHPPQAPASPGPNSVRPRHADDAPAAPRRRTRAPAVLLVVAAALALACAAALALWLG